ncbi:hypothetical protein SAMD00019534_056380, partial [Acytostelium subglobosum LB1]|uniref:hypothetical protein n=1 Tax=Acytostelium subglobosum LB1 TaxID=1410327 RepID=UPI000644D7CA
HWPYCSSICPYCAFNKYLDGPHVNHNAMKQAMCKELTNIVSKYYPLRTPKLTSIYFGGGTPSLAHIDTLQTVVQTAATTFGTPLDSLEITLEVNPDRMDIERLVEFKRHAHINRVSLGVQALNDADLAYLGRTHTAKDARAAIMACNEHFDRVNFDMIYARRSSQSPSEWRAEIKDAISLCLRGHMSLYSLCFEEGTNFFRRMESKKTKDRIIPADHDLGYELYAIAKEETEKAGLFQYEVSNFATPSQQSIHNLNYWRGGDYIGIGPGACSRVTNQSNQKRTSLKCLLHPRSWQAQVDQVGNGLDPKETKELTSEECINEHLLMALRTAEGLNRQRFQSISGGRSLEQVLPMSKLNHAINNGLLILDEQRLYPTPKGMMLLDKVILD